MLYSIKQNPGHLQKLRKPLLASGSLPLYLHITPKEQLLIPMLRFQVGKRVVAVVALVDENSSIAVSG